MNELVDVFIYDKLTGQTDRHEYNWGIVEMENDIYLQPLFDNERLLFFDADFRLLPHTNSEQNVFLDFETCLENIILEFLRVSENKYIKKIKEKLFFITADNIHKIFMQIEEKINAKIPKEIQEEMLNRFQIVENVVRVTIEHYEKIKIR